MSSNAGTPLGSNMTTFNSRPPRSAVAQSNAPTIVKNIFTIDVEDLDAMNFSSMREHRKQASPRRVYESMSRLLDLLAENGSRATMFFLGTVAESYPELVRRSVAEGHEIASHGYAHELVYEQSEQEFRSDVAKSVDILTDITGRPVLGYRAPSWSINRTTPWAYDVLLDLGMKYDSSLFPFRTFLYGDGEAPVSPFLIRTGAQPLFEVPATVLCTKSRRIPFGGGFYLRAMPGLVTRWLTKAVNRDGRSVVFYIHPREIDQAQPRFKLPWKDYLIAYANLAGTYKKLRGLLRLGPTISIAEHLSIDVRREPAVAA